MIIQKIVIEIHQQMIEKTRGAKGIRDIIVLNATINSIYQTFDGQDLYPSIREKASRLCYALNTNHAFIDGNKRIAMHRLALVLRMHNINYRPLNQEVINVGKAVANN